MDRHGYVSDLDRKRDTKQNCDGAASHEESPGRDRRNQQGVHSICPAGTCNG